MNHGSLRSLCLRRTSVPDETSAKSELERLHSAFETVFSQFKSVRQNEWNPLSQRTYRIEIHPEIPGGIAPVEYRPPIFEHTMFDHIDVLQVNPTDFDI